jgi:hypothetical protein
VGKEIGNLLADWMTLTPYEIAIKVGRRSSYWYSTVNINSPLVDPLQGPISHSIIDSPNPIGPSYYFLPGHRGERDFSASDQYRSSMLVFHPAISMLFVVSWNNGGFLLWVRWWYFAEVLFRFFSVSLGRVVGLINSVLRELLFHSVSILDDG